MRQHAKGAVPLLVGDGFTVRDIIGSIRQLKVIDRQPFGSITFASDPAAKAVAAKWQDGHVDVSNLVLDFQVEQGTKIPKGTAYRGYDRSTSSRRILDTDVGINDTPLQLPREFRIVHHNAVGE